MCRHGSAFIESFESSNCCVVHALDSRLRLTSVASEIAGNSSCHASHMLDRNYIENSNRNNFNSSHLDNGLQFDGIVQSRLNDPVLGDRSITCHTRRRSGRTVSKVGAGVRQHSSETEFPGRW